MKSIQARLSGMVQDGQALCFEISGDIPAAMQPGQYLMARGDHDILPIPLYLAGFTGRLFTGNRMLESQWHPGDLLTIRYPLGKGFLNPVNARRLLIVSDTVSPLRLLPVAAKILAEGGEAALFTDHPPDHIPAEIELLDRDQAADAVAWSDFIIGDVSIDRLGAWKQLVYGGRTIANWNIQVLVDAPLLCAGTADCGLCAIQTCHGWKQACTDGPVFALSELEI